MGSIRPSNIKRIAEDLVEKNPGYFTEDFYKNREMLKGVITGGVSKRTENLIAGYVTRYVLKKKARQKKEEEEGLAS